MKQIALSPEGEDLLRALLDEYGPDDYYYENYDGACLADRARIKSIFNEVEKANCITVNWQQTPVMFNITNDGLNYFKYKRLYGEQRKKLNRREWAIAITSVVIGAVATGIVAVALYYFFGIEG